MAGDTAEQQLLEQLDALIEEDPRDELAAVLERRKVMDELLRLPRTVRVAPEGVAPGTASPRVAPNEDRQARGSLISPRVSPRIAPAGVSPSLSPGRRIAPIGYLPIIR